MNLNKYYLLIFLIIFFTLSCVTKIPDDRAEGFIELKSAIDFSSKDFSYLLDTIPLNDKLTFFVSIPRKANREEEILQARYEIAKQAAIFNSVIVETKFATKSNNRQAGTLESIYTSFDESLITHLYDDVHIIHHFRDSKGTYVFAVTNILSKIKIDSIKIKEHDWMYNIPVIPGFLVSVGAVQRSRYPIDSMKKADEQAMANLAKQINVSIKTKRHDVEVDGGTSGFIEIQYEESNATLNGFYVLSRWSGINEDYYYTLALCKNTK